MEGFAILFEWSFLDFNASPNFESYDFAANVAFGAVRPCVNLTDHPKKLKDKIIDEIQSRTNPPRFVEPITKSSFPRQCMYTFAFCTFEFMLAEMFRSKLEPLPLPLRQTCEKQQVLALKNA